MKQGIHPEYTEAVIVCSCGNRIETRSTQEEIHVEICAVCHPFYTGRQKLVDTAGRVERFKRKYGDVSSGADVDEDEAPEAGEAAEASGSEEEAPAPGEGGEEPEAADEGRPRAAAAEEPSGETSEKPEAANA